MMSLLFRSIWFALAFLALAVALSFDHRQQWHFNSHVQSENPFKSKEWQNFLKSVFQQSWQHYPTASDNTFEAVIVSEPAYNMLSAEQAIDVRDAQGDLVKIHPPSWQDFLTDPAYTGLSLVAKPELLDKEHQQALKQVASTAIQRSLQQVFETTVTQHLYASREGAMALQPHTDGGDVFVQQLRGEKHWTVCVPQPKGCEECNDADKALLQEVLKHQRQGCTRYDNTTLKSMACSHFTMVAGDVLYLPRGTVHVATTSNTTSIHMTYQLQSKGHTWAELSGLDVESVDAETYWLLYLGQTSTATSLANPMYRVRQRRSSWNSKGSVGGCKDCEEQCDTGCDSMCDLGFLGCDSGCDSSCDTFRCASSCCPTGQACSGCPSGGCYNCQAGKYAVPSTGCRTCPAGNYQPLTNQATCIIKTKTCPASQYVSNGGGATADRSCAGCPTGRYQPNANSTTTSCTTKAKTCIPGQYAIQDGGATADRNCTDCSTNQYQPVANQNSCITKTRTCSAGRYVSNPNSRTRDRVCSMCANGKYQPNANSIATSCRAKTNTCSTGSYVTNPDSRTSDYTCAPCPTGTAQAKSGVQASCKACQQGYYNDQTGQQACKPCAKHTYTSASRQAGCQACQASQGLYQPQAGQPRCTSCGKGQILNPLTLTCTLCPNGTFQNQSAATTCKNCQADTFSIASRTSCASCAAGKYLSAEASRCQDCAAGKVQPQTGQGLCVTCAEGKYQSQSGKAICKACSLGLSSTRERTTCIDLTPPTITVSNGTWEGGQPWLDPQPIAVLDSTDGDLKSNTTVAEITYLPGHVSITSCPWSRLSSPTSDRDQAQRQARLNTITTVDPHAPAGSVFELLYQVVDNAGNMATARRDVTIIDTLKPALNVSRAIQSLEYRSSVYIHLVTAQDQLDGDITSSICYHVYYVLPVFNATRAAAQPDQLIPLASQWVDPSVPDIRGLNMSDGSIITSSAPVGTKYVINYTVADGADLQDTQLVVAMVVDTVAPTITLSGPSIFRVPFATRYDEPGFSVFDASEGNLTDNTLMNGTSTVDANLDVVGTYYITYTARDRYNNTATAVRAVQVEPFSIPVDDSYIFRLEYSQPLSQSPTASDFETTLRDNVKQPFLFILSRYDSQLTPDRFNALPGSQAPSSSSRRRLLSNGFTVYEFAVRDTESLRWLKTSELLELPDQVVSSIPGVTSVKASSATDTKGNDMTLIVLIAACCGAAFAVALLVVILVRRRRSKRQVMVAAQQGSTPPSALDLHSTNLYNVPELSGSHSRRATVWNQAAAPSSPQRAAIDLTGTRAGTVGPRYATVDHPSSADTIYSTTAFGDGSQDENSQHTGRSTGGEIDHSII